MRSTKSNGEWPSSNDSSPKQNSSGDIDLESNDFKSSSSENSSNLIVNYLPPNMTQDEVRALFSSIGEVESCKLVCDKHTNESLGYSFVKFVKSEDAERAIRNLNGLRLQNKTIKVSHARPSSDAIKGANLYICGLPKKMNQADLENLFKDMGKIITARILYDNKTGLSRGVAFIRFDQKHEAEMAIKKFNGYKLEDAIEPITVKFANSPSSLRQDSSVQQISFSSPRQMSQMSPMSMSSTTPPPPRSNLISPLHQLPSMSRVKYTQPIDIPPNLGDSPTSFMSPALAASTGAFTSTGWCIFVYNLSLDTDDSILWQLFGPFGAVQSVNIVRDPSTGKCKGFGFVTMSNYEEALLAIQSLNGFVIGNRVLQVSFKSSPNQKRKMASGGSNSNTNLINYQHAAQQV